MAPALAVVSIDWSMLTMEVPMSRPGAVPPPRSALVLLSSCAVLAAGVALLPSLTPVTAAVLRVPVWCGIAAVAGLTAAMAVRPAPRRPLVLGAGWLLLGLTGAQAFVIGDLPALLAMWLAVPALALLAGRLRPRGRKALLATHVLASASWVGIAVMVVALSGIAMTSSDSAVTRVSYGLLVDLDLTLLPWANFAATLSGVALGIGTPWGLVRHYWVAVKLALSLLVLAIAFGFQHRALLAAAEAAEDGSDLGALPGVVLCGFVVALLNLVAAMLLSLYKPWGRTPRGRRAMAAGRHRPSPVDA
jgi:hypothetical protein